MSAYANLPVWRCGQPRAASDAKLTPTGIVVGRVTSWSIHGRTKKRFLRKPFVQIVAQEAYTEVRLRLDRGSSVEGSV